MTEDRADIGEDLMTEKSEMNFLVIEDDLVDVRILRRGLKSLGAAGAIVHLASCDEALEFLRDAERVNGIPRPYVILLDINVPGTNGIDFLKKMRALPEAAHHYVVVFTTSKYQKDIDAAYAAGANTYVTKPTFADDLKHLLSGLLNYLDIAQLHSLLR